MIRALEVKNFKSIKHLKLDCRRINILIGKPNSGKSNILETLGLLCFGCYGRYGAGLNEFVRFETMPNLFYDEEVDNDVEIRCDDTVLLVKFENQVFTGIGTKEGEEIFRFVRNYGGGGSHSTSDTVSPFKSYGFDMRKDFQGKEPDFLLPPSGSNLLAVLHLHKGLKSLVDEIFSPFGLRLVFRPQENKIEVLKQIGDTLILHPYSLTSDTLQRLVFYLMAIESNKDSVLALEEPESHAFPYYTKYLAEVIALDNRNNQYFISTHNPYLFLSILEKAPKSDMAVFIVDMEDYQTKVKLLSEDQLGEAMEMDIFSNIERFLEEK